MNREEMKKRDSEQRMVHFYGIAELGAKLNPNQPFFWTSDSAMYAIETRSVTEKVVPTNFRRLDKNRQLSGRQRVIARKLNNKLEKEQEAQKNEFSKGFTDVAAGRA